MSNREPIETAIAVALYVLRSERAPETERNPAERGGRPIYGEA